MRMTFNTKLKAHFMVLTIFGLLKINDSRPCVLQHGEKCEIITSGVWKTGNQERNSKKWLQLKAGKPTGSLFYLRGAIATELASWRKNVQEMRRGGVKREVFVNGSHILIPAYKPRLAVAQQELKLKCQIMEANADLLVFEIPHWSEWFKTSDAMIFPRSHYKSSGFMQRCQYSSQQ